MTTPADLSAGEEWRPVVGWEGFYEVSSTGRVRSVERLLQVRCACGHGIISKRCPGRILQIEVDTRGYLAMKLCRKGKKQGATVHRLVCEAFQGPPPTPEHVVAHFDGDRTNASASNLRWATQRENAADRERHGTVLRGEAHPSSTLTVEEVAELRSARPGQLTKIARRMGISQGHASNIKSRKIWKHI